MKQINLTNFILESFNYNNIEHLKTILMFNQDEEINKYIIITSDSFNEILKYYSLTDEESIYNKFYMVKLTTGEIIGSIELDGTKNDLYINYCILKPYRGNGYCTTLLKEITKYLSNELSTISLLIKEENQKSKNVAIKAGYKMIGYDSFGYYKYQINTKK